VLVRSLAGKRVLITAGPTFEAIDPVRGIINRSSGRMGFALARAAREAGAEVSLVCGPVALPGPRGVARVDVTGALEMRAAVMERIAGQDAFIGVAAVADYRPRTVSDQKAKKDGAPPAPIELVENPDILAEVAALPDPPLCVGFAAETRNLDEYAEKKRRAKKIPLIVGNLIEDGFGGETNTVVLFDDDGRHALDPAPKLALARQLVARVAGLLGNANKG
jgi:phosphopantothenoylcysteine decarboxylase/phosphopantothenate--cysteine ligase